MNGRIDIVESPVIDIYGKGCGTGKLIETTEQLVKDSKILYQNVWIVFDKDDLGHSELCALSDFKVRSDASFEKDYLSGVYGGIPFLKDFSLKAGE